MSRKERENRILNPKGGWSETSSTDFFFLVDRLHELATQEADSLDGNTTSYTWAALPMLLSGLDALMLEQEAMFLNQRKEDRLETLISSSPLPEKFAVLYGTSGELLQDLGALVELRNEIIHPAHLPLGTRDNWPDYLRCVKDLGVVQSTGDPNADYLMLGQMKSLRLLRWALEVVARLKEVVLRHHGRFDEISGRESSEIAGH